MAVLAVLMPMVALSTLYNIHVRLISFDYQTSLSASSGLPHVAAMELIACL